MLRQEVSPVLEGATLIVLQADSDLSVADTVNVVNPLEHVSYTVLILNLSLFLLA